jgi:hypothetical protein
MVKKGWKLKMVEILMFMFVQDPDTNRNWFENTEPDLNPHEINQISDPDTKYGKYASK